MIQVRQEAQGRQVQRDQLERLALPVLLALLALQAPLALLAPQGLPVSLVRLDLPDPRELPVLLDLQVQLVLRGPPPQPLVRRVRLALLALLVLPAQVVRLAQQVRRRTSRPAS